MFKFKKTVRFYPFIFILAASFAFAENDKKEDVPPGMEVIEVGQTKVVVPKDSQIRKEGGLIILESPNQYVARRLVDFDQRLSLLEKQTLELKNQIGQLEKALEDVKE